MKRFLVQSGIPRLGWRAGRVSEFDTPRRLPGLTASLALRKPVSLYN